MSASTKSERLLQRMNRRTENTAASADEGMDQKRDILDTLVGSKSAQNVGLAKDTTDQDRKVTSDSDNPLQQTNVNGSIDLDYSQGQVTVTSHRDKLISQGNTSFDIYNPINQVDEKSDTSLSNEQSTLTNLSDKIQVQSTMNGKLPPTQGNVTLYNPLDFAQGLTSIADQVAQEAKSHITKRETHKQATYQLPKELLKRFDKIALRHKEVRGFKEKTIQHLLEQFCDAMEAQQKKR